MIRIYLLAISLSVTIFVTACGNESPENNPSEADPENLAEHVESLNQNDEFEEALDLLREADQEDPQIQEMLETVHLNYALHLTHVKGMEDMREYMPMALRHYRRVLELNPDNDRAQQEKQQIVEIYQQLGRDVPEGVAE